MPFYEYRYTTVQGQSRVVERKFKMGEAPETVVVQDGDEVYTAERIISLTARMATNWEVKDTVSDLPPENSPLLTGDD